MSHIDFEDINVVWGWKKVNNCLLWDRIRLVHAVGGDTDSGMFKIPQEIVDTFQSEEDMVAFADKIGKETNEEFPEFVMRAFNAPESRKHTIATDREIVSDVSLFLTKKRYIMHVINDEGKKVDKKKIMGVELKKSDTPTAVKEMLEVVVDSMLAGETEESVQALIEKMKIDYKNYSIVDIARPISIKGMNKYSAIYDQTGSMAGFPYNIRAAMFYNSLCSNSDRKAIPGDKIGVVYIDHPDSPYIGFPLDERLPDFVYDLVIDYDTQWQKAHKKIMAYMSSVGWDFKSKKQETRKNLFGDF